MMRMTKKNLTVLFSFFMSLIELISSNGIIIVVKIIMAISSSHVTKRNGNIIKKQLLRYT